jgi:nitroreductase
MDVLGGILSRRMVPKVSDRRPERSQIEQLLQAGVRAPNHYLTEPWRFLVLTGKALDELGEAMAERLRRESVGDPNLDQKIEMEKSRPRRAPVILTVVYGRSSDPRAVEVEDRYAVGAAMQNILLSAHALGLGAYLRTGPAASDPEVAKFLGLKEGEEVAGFIYLGYPSEDSPRPMTPRTPPQERTSWRGWD